MSTDARNPDPPSEDIDLLLLVERIILFFRKYKWVFLVAIVLGLSSGIFIYRSLPTLYRSRLLLHSFILTNQEHLQVIGTWNELLQKHEYAELAAAFHCREDIFYKLRQLKAEEIQKVFSPENPNGFVIEVTVTDNSILDELQNGIVYGLDNTPYIKDRLDLKRGRLAELIDKTSTEIKKLDSTKKNLENIISGKEKSSSSLIIDGSSINRQFIEMNEKLLSFREELQFTNAVQVIQNFSKFRAPVKSSLIALLTLGVIFFVSLAFLHGVYRSISRRLKNRSHPAITRSIAPK